jgi:hypothetical protein
MIPSVHQQPGQVPPESLLRSEYEMGDRLMSLGRGLVRRIRQSLILGGRDQHVRNLRRAIDDPHGLALGHRLPLLGV